MVPASWDAGTLGRWDAGQLGSLARKLDQKQQLVACTSEKSVRAGARP